MGSIFSYFQWRRSTHTVALSSTERFQLDNLPKGRVLRASRQPLRLRGLAIDLRTATPIKVRIRIGKRTFSQAAKDRNDVQDIFGRDAPASSRCGFEFQTKIPFGIRRLAVELADGAGGWRPIFQTFVVRTSFRFRRSDKTISYGRWRRIQKRIDFAELPAIGSKIDLMPLRPRFSLIVDCRCGGALASTVSSIENQVYPNWDIRALTDDQRADARQRDGRDIEIFSTIAPLKAEGDYVVFLRAGDLLDPLALYRFANAINIDPSADLVYADEEWQTSSYFRAPRPFFKPAWSPDYLENFNYIGYPACFRATLAVAAFANWHYYDFVLRFSEQTDRIQHVGSVLCVHPQVTMDDTVTEAQRRLDQDALHGRLERTGRSGHVVAKNSKDANRYYTSEIDLRHRPLVSIIIPTAGKVVDFNGRALDLVVNCVSQVRDRSSYKNIELIIVDNGNLDSSQISKLNTLGCRFITYSDDSINIAKKLNLGATIAVGEIFLLLNDDIELITADWIERMLEHFEKSHVGVVGAKLLYPSGLVQHAGVVHNSGDPAHAGRLRAGDDDGYFFSAAGSRNYMAVTGACMMTRADVFRAVGGYSEDLAISFNDADYCMKVSGLGLYTLCAAQSVLVHLESQSREVYLDANESELYHARWAAQIVSDPFYNERCLSVRPPTFEVRCNRRVI